MITNNSSLYINIYTILVYNYFIINMSVFNYHFLLYSHLILIFLFKYINYNISQKKQNIFRLILLT